MNAAPGQPENPLSENDGYHFISSHHSTTGFQKMHTMQRQSKLCDIMVTVGDEVYSGHKLVFASISEYFSDMFDEIEPAGSCEVHIDNISPNAFRSIFQFFYTGEIVITAVNVIDLISASQKFKIDLLEAACGVSLSKLLNPSTWIKIKAVAGEKHYDEFYQKCHAYSLQHFEDIIEEESFLQLPFCDVKELIVDDDLMVSSDDVVYSAVLKWVKYDLLNREENLAELMRYVKLPLIDKTYFMSNVMREPLIRDNLECSKLLLEAMEYHSGMQYHETSSRALPRKYFAPNIFVTGGTYEETTTSDCEMYNSRTDTWHSFSPMQCVRSAHALIGFRRLLYAFGGFDGKALASAEYYDPLHDTWSMTTSLPYERYGHGICIIDNIIYLCGGRNNVYINSVDKFDPITGKYMTCAPMKSKRGYFNLEVIDNCIYAIGGYDTGKLLKSMEMFDPREGKWSDAPSMSTPRWEAGAAVLDGCIYVPPVIEGSVWERFNTRRNLWEQTDTNDEWSLLNQDVCPYVVGSSIKSLQKYDPIQNSVILLPPMIKKRSYLSAAITYSAVRIKN